MASRLLRSIAASSPNTLKLTGIPSRPLLRTSFQHTSCRSASTSTKGSSSAAPLLENIFYGTSLTLAAVFAFFYFTDTRASVHRWLVVPALQCLYPDAEEAHAFGTKALKLMYALGIHPRERTTKKDLENNILKVNVFGHDLLSPIATSAGIDKHAEVPDALMALGASIVEVGGTTPLPQDGNPKPRCFRLPSQDALINRYGLNSKGAEEVARVLRERVRFFAYKKGFGADEKAERLVLDGGAGVPPGSLTEGKLLAVQVAKNKSTPADDFEAVKRDYVFCVETLARYADIIVVNVSSPNTPGLRSLQAVDPLTNILRGVVGAAKLVDRKTKPAVMVKVSPDEDSDEQMEGIAQAVWMSGVDGVIVGNTTNRRIGLIEDSKPLSAQEAKTFTETGGFSGPPMFQRTLGLVKRYRRLLDQGSPPSTPELTTEESDSSAETQHPSDISPQYNILQSLPTPKDNITPKVLFATGGITNGHQALQILNAGASVAMLYTAIVYGGSGTLTRIKREMRDEISSSQKRDGQE